MGVSRSLALTMAMNTLAGCNPEELDNAPTESNQHSGSTSRGWESDPVAVNCLNLLLERASINTAAQLLMAANVSAQVNPEDGTITLLSQVNDSPNGDNSPYTKLRLIVSIPGQKEAAFIPFEVSPDPEVEGVTIHADDLFVKGSFSFKEGSDDYALTGTVDNGEGECLSGALPLNCEKLSAKSGECAPNVMPPDSPENLTWNFIGSSSI